MFLYRKENNEWSLKYNQEKDKCFCTKDFYQCSYISVHNIKQPLYFQRKLILNEILQHQKHILNIIQKLLETLRNITLTS